jgi:hypothetical protein
MNGMNNLITPLQAEKFSVATNTDVQKKAFSAHWSFLNDSEITKIINLLFGMKLDDLKHPMVQLILNWSNKMGILLIIILF